MRKILILLAFTALSASVAQAKFHLTPKSHPFTKAILKHVISNAANKSTGVPSRLVAKSTFTYFNSAYKPFDSGRLSYGGMRGEYDAFMDDWNYDLQTKYDYTGTYTPAGRITKTYNGANQIQTILTESYNGSTWENNERASITYSGSDVSGLLDETWNGTAWENSYKTSFVYDANHNPLVVTEEAWVSNAWAIVYRTTNTYNAGNNLLTSTEEEDKGTGLDLSYRTTNTYTANKLTSELEEVWNGSGWDNEFRYTSTYNSSSGDLTEYLTEQWNGSAWENDSKQLSTFDANHNQLTNVFMSWNGTAFENEFRNVMTYNGWNQELTRAIESWNGSAFAPKNSDPLVRNYYEMFNNDVKKTTVQNASLKTYPVPAGNELNIEMSFKQPAVFGVTISDMTGKILAAWTEQPAAQYRKTINAANLLSGSYILRVSAGAEQLQQKLNIVK